MIVFLIYLLGLFLTPIILKKFYNLSTDKELEPLDRDTILIICSMLWPLAIILRLFFKIAELLIFIYNKV